MRPRAAGFIGSQHTAIQLPALACIILTLSGAAATSAIAAPAAGAAACQAVADHPGAPAYWIYLKERPPEASHMAPALSPRALRRLERIGRQPDASDLPVWPPWVAALKEIGVRPRVCSRWFHAVSARLDEPLRKRVEELAFVERVIPVRRLFSGRRDPRGIGPEPRSTWPESRGIGPDYPDRPARESGLSIRRPDPPGGRGLWAGDFIPTGIPADYGDAFGQVAMLGVPELHARGYSGEGVLIAILDAGFHKDHFALEHLDIVAEYDFIDEDEQTQNWDGQSGRGDYHGTYTLTALAGLDPGWLVGPAYGASFLLARTEEIDWEKGREEDAYVWALEWADSIGADLVSSSLGYRYFPQDDSPWGYEFSELDGQTAVTTDGVNRAAKKGMLVVTAVGNEGPGASTLLVPADSDSALAVGAVTPWGTVTAFSSRGPTSDGRKKPDLCAQGWHTVCGVWSESGYVDIRYANGTSLATPLIAGLAALLLEANPQWGPMELIAALRESGDRSSEPDNIRGHGLPWGPLVMDPEAPALVVDSLRWSSAPQVGKTCLLEVRFTNRGGAASEQATISPYSMASGLACTELAAVLGALAPGERAWVGGWEVNLNPFYDWAWIVMGISLPEEQLFRWLGFWVAPPQTPSPVAITLAAPNPWTGREALVFGYAHPIGGPADIEILDPAGRLVLRLAEQIELVQGGGGLTFEPDLLARVPSGRYILRLGSAWGSASRPLVLVR